jgi:hypothetical protein
MSETLSTHETEHGTGLGISAFGHEVMGGGAWWETEEDRQAERWRARMERACMSCGRAAWAASDCQCEVVP